MIEEDLRLSLINEPTISAIIGNRMFLKNPINEQDSAYISYIRSDRTRDMVADKNRFKLILYSTSSLELINLTEVVIAHLENRKLLNGTLYYSLSFVNQVDSDEKLKNGFYWTILEYEFKNTI